MSPNEPNQAPRELILQTLTALAPAFRRISVELRAAIEGGELHKGDVLPSEAR